MSDNSKILSISDLVFSVVLNLRNMQLKSLNFQDINKPFYIILSVKYLQTVKYPSKIFMFLPWINHSDNLKF